uniref:Uncharacterized protein n=1 Tax=Rhizophora mucronata TaxID=61149 RepID=A0A2P2KJH3_RHIMU
MHSNNPIFEYLVIPCYKRVEMHSNTNLISNFRNQLRPSKVCHP